jgi:ribose 5-phosphate isomerase B
MTHKRIGIATDHGGFILREYLMSKLREDGFEVVDFGNTRLEPDDDYPDYVVRMARAVANAELFRGIAICGSGVGACVAEFSNAERHRRRLVKVAELESKFL